MSWVLPSKILSILHGITDIKLIILIDNINGISVIFNNIYGIVWS